MGKHSVNVNDVKIGDVLVKPIRHRSRVLECLAPISSEEDGRHPFVSCLRLKFDWNVPAGFGVSAGNMHVHAVRNQSSAHRHERVARPAILWRYRWNYMQNFHGVGIFDQRPGLSDRGVLTHLPIAFRFLKFHSRATSFDNVIHGDVCETAKPLCCAHS